MRVIITIPAYNEEKTLPGVLEDIKRVMKKTSYQWSVQVVDDGSSDKTAEKAKEQDVVVYKNSRNIGLAETFKKEIQYCLAKGADVIVHTDADGQYDPEGIPALIKKIEEGYDLVLGSRFMQGNYKGSVLKNFGNRLFSLTLSQLMKAKVTDTTTGFRAFTKEVASEINFINTFTYTQEQIIKAAKMRFKIGEVSIKTKETRESRLFRNPAEYAFKAWVNILRILRDFNPLKFFGSIGIAMIILGVLVGSGLIIAFLQGVTDIDSHIPTLLLAMLLFTTGLQILLFGFLADKNER